MLLRSAEGKWSCQPLYVVKVHEGFERRLAGKPHLTEPMYRSFPNVSGHRCDELIGNLDQMKHDRDLCGCHVSDGFKCRG